MFRHGDDSVQDMAVINKEICLNSTKLLLLLNFANKLRRPTRLPPKLKTSHCPRLYDTKMSGRKNLKSSRNRFICDLFCFRKCVSFSRINCSPICVNDNAIIPMRNDRKKGINKTRTIRNILNVSKLTTSTRARDEPVAFIAPK